MINRKRMKRMTMETIKLLEFATYTYLEKGGMPNLSCYVEV